MTGYGKRDVYVESKKMEDTVIKKIIRTVDGGYFTLPRILKMLGKIPQRNTGGPYFLPELIDNSIDALLSAEKTNPNWISEELGLDYYPIQITLPTELQLSEGVGKNYNRRSRYLLHEPESTSGRG